MEKGNKKLEVLIVEDDKKNLINGLHNHGAVKFAEDDEYGTKFTEGIGIDELSLLYEKVLGKELEQHIKVDIAMNAKSGLEKLDNKKYNVIITDIGMPYINNQKIINHISYDFVTKHFEEIKSSINERLDLEKLKRFLEERSIFPKEEESFKAYENKIKDEIGSKRNFLKNLEKTDLKNKEKRNNFLDMAFGPINSFIGNYAGLPGEYNKNGLPSLLSEELLKDHPNLLDNEEEYRFNTCRGYNESDLDLELDFSDKNCSKRMIHDFKEQMKSKDFRQNVYEIFKLIGKGDIYTHSYSPEEIEEEINNPSFRKVYGYKVINRLKEKEVKYGIYSGGHYLQSFTDLAKMVGSKKMYDDMLELKREINHKEGKQAHVKDIDHISFAIYADKKDYIETIKTMIKEGYINR